MWLQGITQCYATSHVSIRSSTLISMNRTLCVVLRVQHCLYLDTYILTHVFCMTCHTQKAFLLSGDALHATKQGAEWACILMFLLLACLTGCYIHMWSCSHDTCLEELSSSWCMQIMPGQRTAVQVAECNGHARLCSHCPDRHSKARPCAVLYIHLNCWSGQKKKKKKDFTCRAGLLNACRCTSDAPADMG